MIQHQFRKHPSQNSEGSQNVLAGLIVVYSVVKSATEQCMFVHSTCIPCVHSQPEYKDMSELKLFRTEATATMHSDKSYILLQSIKRVVKAFMYVFLGDSIAIWTADITNLISV